jgi:putative component of membrane protein insertase Oxa1/YidC/SpoIIIJ protein YidD
VKATITLIILSIMFADGALAQNDPMKGPWPATNPNNLGQVEAKKTLGPGRALVNFYQEYISPIDGSACGMAPSCSEYGKEAFEKHGFFAGWMMTMDRLFRCGRDELKLSPWIRVNGEFKCNDPVENNDFWWSDTK